MQSGDRLRLDLIDRAIVLLSGGLDSTTALAWALAAGYDCYPMTFIYGQRHGVELQAARAVAKHYDLEARYKVIGLPNWGGSALNDQALDVPHGRDADAMADDIPPTYVPARNTILLAYATAYAEIKRASAIVIGVNALDYSGYPDCRPEYIRAFSNMANLATKRAIEGNKLTIQTPLIAMTKAAIIREATLMGAPLHLTHSCYDPVPVRGSSLRKQMEGQAEAATDWLACGTCDACVLRKKGFMEAGVPDPTRYAETAA